MKKSVKIILTLAIVAMMALICAAPAFAAPSDIGTVSSVDENADNAVDETEENLDSSVSDSSEEKAEEPKAEKIVEEDVDVEVEKEDTSAVPVKAIAAAAIMLVVCAAGAIAMAMTVKKSVDGTARQPEAAGSIRTTMMMGLVFIETAIIYALIVAILIIFVL